MSQDVYVAGVGMIPFAKPGSSRSMPAMFLAIRAAVSAPSTKLA